MPQVWAVDVNTEALAVAKASAYVLNLTNVHLVEGCAASFRKERVDLVLSLHACGGLSDVGVELARSHGCSFLVRLLSSRLDEHFHVKITQLV